MSRQQQQQQAQQGPVTRVAAAGSAGASPTSPTISDTPSWLIIDQVILYSQARWAVLLPLYILSY